MNNVETNKSKNENPSVEEFTIHNNPLFDDEYVVFHANKNL